MMVAEQKFTKLGATVADLEIAWRDRLADAEALLAAGRNAGAIVAALYALEIRLKVLICARLDLESLPRAFETHDLDGLLLLAGLSRRLQGKKACKVLLNWDAILIHSRRLVEMRYTPDLHTSAQAAAFLSCLKDTPNGVLPWLSRQR